MPTPNPNYFLETVRTASFKTQRRTSSAKGGSQFKWPHKTMPPINFVKAGFYFQPDAEHPDNVTCYLCNKSLDGWEPEDDPTAEHYRHSPNCGAAITAYTQAITDGSYTSNPHSESFADARLTTFGYGLWPHERLPNLCTEMMANAGFHYAPTKEEPDYCLCPFCGVSLANFEPEDDPRMEHYRRAPNCYFFKTEPKKGKRGSRTSTVPRGRRASRATSVAPGPPIERGRSRDSNDLADDEEPPAKKPRGKRAGSVKPKAGAKRGGRKKAVPDYTESIHSVSDAEEPPKRGRKRSSSVFDSNEPVVLFDGRMSTDEEDQVVAQPKKRATRASVVRGGGIDTVAPPKRQRATRGSIIVQPTVDYGTLTDAEDAMASKPVKGRRTVSKTTKSASKPKTYVPADQDLDNSLVQDEPSTDEDDSAPQKPFVRSTKKPTKSRTSLAIEQQMRDAPSDVLVPAAGKAKTKTPRAGTREPGITGTPLRPFFRDDQDFSLPVSVPRHLNRDIEILDQHSDAPSEAEDSAAEQPPAKKGRGRPRKMSPTTEASKAQRTNVTKKGAAAGSKSRTSESERPTVDIPEEAPPAGPIQSPPREIEPEFEPEHGPEQTGEPKRGRKKQRESEASITDDPPHPDVPEDSENHSGETDSESEQHSDADSVVQHVVEVRDSIHTNDEESSPELPAEEAQGSEPEEPVTKPTRKSLRKTSPVKAHVTEEEQPSIHSSPSQEHTSPEPEPAPTPIDHDTDVSEVFLPESLHGTPAKDTPRQHRSLDRAERQSSEVSVSPVRRQLTIPLVTTPKEKVRTLQSSRPWSPADLDAVFAASGDDEEEVAGLTAAERAMTVEEWVKWNARNAERRLTERAERMVAMFEEKGREAMACIEGIPTTS